MNDGTMNVFQGCSSEENTQQTTSSRGFFAVVLRRDHEDAEEAEVLLPSDEYRSFDDYGDRVRVETADDLGEAARQEAEKELQQEIDELILVYADNPTFTHPADLTYCVNVRLNLECKALGGETVLITTREVPRWYVLVTAPAQQQVVPMQFAAVPAPAPPIQDRVSIEEFLKSKGWWTTVLPSPQELFKLVDLPRIGRTKELQAIWKMLNVKEGGPRRAMLYFHASPGVGKSFVMSELMEKRLSDIPAHCRALAASVGFLVLNFNGFQEASVIESALYQTQRESPIVLRLVYNVCCDKHVSFHEFVQAVKCSVRLESLTVKSTWAMLRAQIGSKQIVVLVDEVLKSRQIHEQLPDIVRECLSHLMDEDPAVEVVFSVLNQRLLRLHSGRPMVPVTALPLLPVLEVKEMIEPMLQVDGHTYAGVTVSKASLAKTLASVSGGHARALEHLLSVVQNGTQSIEALITKLALKHYSAFYHGVSETLLHVILRGDTVLKTDVVPNFGTVTFEDLVARGMLIDSFKNYHPAFIPALPELHFRAWVACLPKEEDLTMTLNSMLALHTRFTATGFETFHALWERMIRHCRSDAEFGAVTLLELYRFPKTKDNPFGAQPKATTTTRGGTSKPPTRYEQHDSASELSELSELHCQLLGTVCVDGSTRLKYRAFDTDFNWAGFNVADNIDTCFKPNDAQNAGWDHFIIFRAHNNASGFLVVFYEETFSADKSKKTVLSTDDVTNKYQHCAASARDDLRIPEFVVVFVCRRSIAQSVITSAPSNCIFLDTDKLRELYGRTLMSFLDDTNDAADMVPHKNDTLMPTPDAKLLRQQRELMSGGADLETDPSGDDTGNTSDEIPPLEPVSTDDSSAGADLEDAFAGLDIADEASKTSH